MSTTPESSAAFFEAMYREDTDPWNFAGSSYELSRYQAIFAALSHRRYRRAFEPGCSIGVLTERLAGICVAVVGVDFSETAIAQARERCAHLPNVTLSYKSLTEALPVEGFDLIVLSEIGYYFAAEEWSKLSGELIRSLAPGATLLGAHWLGSSPDHQLNGDQVQTILAANPLLRLEHSERHEAFRLERWTRL
jgi:SAM-dependent methyltransferase